MTLSRQKQINQRGSPSYPLYLGAVAAGVTYSYDLEQETGDGTRLSGLRGASNYLPLDYVYVVNNDVVDIEVIINDTKHFYYPAGLAQGITEVNVYKIAVKNLDGSTSTTANKISITARRKPMDTDSFARKLGGLFGG